MILAADAGRIFGLDAQFVFQFAFAALAVFLLFLVLSYILFDPVRKILKDREKRIADLKDTTERDKVEANQYKAEYEARLRNVEKEAEAILSEARKKALKREDEIIENAKAEAARIIEHANREAELEKKKVKEEVKQEVIDVATMMAGKIIGGSIDNSKQDALIQETLEEMGDKTWLS